MIRVGRGCWYGLWISLLLGMSGCIIGTWPTPEDAPTATGGGNQQPVGEELCDGMDNDADGTIDEGCPCGSQIARGCLGTRGEQCGVGVQWCNNGTWGGCADIGPPYTAANQPAVEILSVTPDTMSSGGSEVLSVEVEVTPLCDALMPPEVTVSLAAVQPTMRLVTGAKDSGTDSDHTALDGVYSVTITNPFGPGVLSPQNLVLSASVRFGDAESKDQTTVVLESP